MDRKPIPESAFPLLLELINETYLDGMDSIQEATADPDGRLRGIAVDEGDLFAFEYFPEDEHLEVGLILEKQGKSASFAGGKTRNCKAGIACGGSCISKSKTCRKKASSSQQEKVKEITALVWVPGKGSSAEKPAKKSTKKSKSTAPTPASEPTAKKEKKPSSKALEKKQKKVEAAKESALKGASKVVLSDPDMKKVSQAKLQGMVDAAKERISAIGEAGDYTKMSAKDLTTVLLDTDGEEKMDLLGVDSSYYNPKSTKPKEMLKSISKKIHPDVNKDPRANKAMVALNDYVEGMKW